MLAELHRRLFATEAWFQPGRGPRYAQMARHIAALITAGDLLADTQLPPERELAAIAAISRVTVRQAVAQLVEEGLLEQRRGAGTFVCAPRGKMEHSLSNLLSFTDYMRQRGKTPTSQVLERGLFQPSPDEQIALGLSPGALVARIERLRSADGVPMAVERSSLPVDVLPDPHEVGTSLYDVLRARDMAPVRAVQRMTAVNLPTSEARLLSLPDGAAVLRIDRTGYLPSGRPIEFTRGLYRSDIYDFVAVLRLEAAP
jgi:GntR family transcriptional regulator